MRRPVHPPTAPPRSSRVGRNGTRLPSPPPPPHCRADTHRAASCSRHRLATCAPCNPHRAREALSGRWDGAARRLVRPSKTNDGNNKMQPWPHPLSFEDRGEAERGGSILREHPLHPPSGGKAAAPPRDFKTPRLPPKPKPRFWSASSSLCSRTSQSRATPRSKSSAGATSTRSSSTSCCCLRLSLSLASISIWQSLWRTFIPSSY